jgi:hypothetical protein
VEETINADLMKKFKELIQNRVPVEEIILYQIFNKFPEFSTLFARNLH